MIKKKKKINAFPEHPTICQHYAKCFIRAKVVNTDFLPKNLKSDPDVHKHKHLQ